MGLILNRIYKKRIVLGCISIVTYRIEFSFVGRFSLEENIFHDWSNDLDNLRAREKKQKKITWWWIHDYKMI